MKRIKKIDGWCAVVALQFLSGLPEKIVLEVCKIDGFDPFHGFDDEDWPETAKDLGIKLEKLRIGKYPHRLKQFKKKHPYGKFLIGTYDHLFVMMDGIIVDPVHGEDGWGRIVREAWRVI